MDTTMDTAPSTNMKTRETLICFSGAILMPSAEVRSLEISVEEEVRNILAEDSAAASMAAYTSTCAQMPR